MKREYFHNNIVEFTPTRPDGNWTGNVVYVKSHEYHKDNENCPSKYVNIMNKCFWLLCGRSTPTDAEYGCSEKLGTLASLDEIGLTRIVEYLNFTKAINSGVTQITVGLSRRDGKWIWNDGREYNVSGFTFDTDSKNSQGYLTWTGEKWILKAGTASTQHHLCEKRGGNVAYKSWSNQSSTLPGFPSQFAVDGLYYTISITLLPKELSQKSWWKLILDYPAKIYLIMTERHLFFKEPNAEVTLSLHDDATSPNVEKKLKILSNSKSAVICDPPTLARYVTFLSKGEDLQLMEVEVYTADSVDDIRGVMRGYS